MSENEEPKAEAGPAVRRLAGGVHRIDLSCPVEGGRKVVDVRPVRIRDVRELATIDTENMSGADAIALMAKRFTDLKEEELDDLSLEDTAAIREVIESQMGKL